MKEEEKWEEKSEVNFFHNDHHVREETIALKLMYVRDDWWARSVKIWLEKILRSFISGITTALSMMNKDFIEVCNLIKANNCMYIVRT